MRTLTLLLMVIPVVGSGCSADGNGSTSFDTLSGTIGPGGGTVKGEVGSVFEGIEVRFSEGALTEETTVTVTEGTDTTPLPEQAFSVGTQWAIEADFAPASPIQVTLPVDEQKVADFGQDFTMVKVWIKASDGTWTKLEPVDTKPGLVTIETSDLSILAPGVKLEESDASD